MRPQTTYSISTLMRKRVFLVALMATALLLAATAANSAAAESFYSASGSGVNDAGERFTFFAQEGPMGPSGYADIEFPPSQTYPLDV
jgi:hypothetical protein